MRPDLAGFMLLGGIAGDLLHRACVHAVRHHDHDFADLVTLGVRIDVCERRFV